MGEPKTFLTDKRRAVLTGKYEGAENTERVHRRNIKNRATTALEELIEVAESDVIDNTEVFDPVDVHRLLIALTTPPMTDGPVDPINPEDSLDDDWQAYRDRLYVQMSKVQTFQRETDQ